jgi:hypothetical protein
MAVFELLFRLPFNIDVVYLRLRHVNCISLYFGRLDVSVCARANLPKLYYFVVSAK